MSEDVSRSDAVDPDAIDSDASGSDLPKRDRSALRRADRTRRRGGGGAVASFLGSVVWEVLLEVVFLVLVGLVSWLVYGDLRWGFIAVVFLGVNAVLAVIALAAFARRRGRRRSASGRGDVVRNRTGL